MEPSKPRKIFNRAHILPGLAVAAATVAATTPGDLWVRIAIAASAGVAQAVFERAFPRGAVAMAMGYGARRPVARFVSLALMTLLFEVLTHALFPEVSGTLFVWAAFAFANWLVFLIRELSSPRTNDASYPASPLLASAGPRTLAQAQPVSADVQRAYNYALGWLRGPNRMGGYMLLALTKEAKGKPRKTFAKLADGLERSAAQFGALSQLTGFPGLATSSAKCAQAAELFNSAQGLHEAGDREGATNSASQGLRLCAEAQVELESNCPIRFRYWFANPVRYWPRPLPGPERRLTQ